MISSVERFTPDPEHGRPMVALFTCEAGSLAVHCDREDGSLWIFCTGPRGGDRGRVVVPPRLAEEALSWADEGRYLNSDYLGAQSGLMGMLTIRDGRVHVIRRGAAGDRWWEGRYEPEHRDELRLCVREWATVALAVSSS